MQNGVISGIVRSTTTLSLTPMELNDVNLVRIFLQVITVNYMICTAEGTHVQSKVWKVRPLHDRTSNLTWPRHLQQTKEQEATLWRRLLHKLLRKKPGDLHRLMQPIGAWNNDSHICWHKMRYCRSRRDPDEVPSQGFVRLSLQLFSCCCPPTAHASHYDAKAGHPYQCYDDDRT